MLTKETIKITREYTTKDLCLAVILKMNGVKIKKLQSIDGRRFIFHFEDNPMVKEIVSDYFLLSINDHPYKKFYQEMREIKNLIYNNPTIDKN